MLGSNTVSEVFDFVWRLLGADQVPTRGVELVLYAGYAAAAAMTAIWLKRRVLPELVVAHSLYRSELANDQSARSPIDVAAAFLLTRFIVGMGARPERHQYLLNLERGDHCADHPPSSESRTRIVLDFVLSPTAASSDFRTGPTASARAERLLRIAESIGIFSLATVLVLDGLVVLPWILVSTGRLDGRAITFLVLAHGFMQLLGRVHRATRTVELATGLLRPSAVLLGGLGGLALFDMPEVVPAAQNAYLIAWVVAVTAVSYLIGHLLFVASAKSSDHTQMEAIVTTIRVGAVAVFTCFALANGLATLSIGVSAASFEYVVFLIAHTCSALAIGFGQWRRGQTRQRQ